MRRIAFGGLVVGALALCAVVLYHASPKREERDEWYTCCCG